MNSTTTTKRSSRSGEFSAIPLESLRIAPWNYKEGNKSLTKKLIANLRRNGQLENLVVRELEPGVYEVVNGNHRLEAYQQMKVKEAICLNLGNVPVEQAMRVAIELNETKFPTNDRKLAMLVQAILKRSDRRDVVSTLPFNDVELDAMVRGLDPDWTQFDYGEVEVTKKARPVVLRAPQAAIDQFMADVRKNSTNEENLSTLEAIPVEHFCLTGSAMAVLLSSLSAIMEKYKLPNRDLAFEFAVTSLLNGGGGNGDGQRSERKREAGKTGKVDS